LKPFRKLEGFFGFKQMREARSEKLESRIKNQEARNKRQDLPFGRQEREMRKLEKIRD
jgi:hypothetical protein